MQTQAVRTVGSSSNRSAGCRNNAQAKDTRILQPPDRMSTGPSWSLDVNPRPVKMTRA